MSAGSENSEFVNKSNCGKTRSRDFNFVMLFADQDPLAAPNRPIQNTELEVNSGGLFTNSQFYYFSVFLINCGVKLVDDIVELNNNESR